MTIKLTVKDRTDRLRKALRDITAVQVYVGITEEKASRKGEPVNNAELMCIHTHGSPLRNIPARPVIEPAIEAEGNKEHIAGEFKEVIKSILDVNPEEARKHLERAGQLGESAARDWFEDPRNGWAPNAPATIARKGSDRPLIDTDALRKSITHIVKDNNA